MSHPYYLYKVTLNDSGKFYLGITNSPIQRKNQHLNILKNGIHHCADLQKDFPSKKEYSFHEIAKFHDKKSAYECEQLLLKYADCFYNKPTGLSEYRPISRKIQVPELSKKKFLNATESTNFLGLKYRQEFYRLRDKYELQGEDFGGRILYALTDLKRIKKLLEKK